MPNWCENNLSIYGKIDDMRKLIDVIKTESGEYELLERLYPTPPELLEGNDWYMWRINNWGTKWTESDLQVGQDYTEMRIDKAVIAFNFNSAWSPPIEAFDKIAKDYPKLIFCLYYEEPGMMFCGSNVWGNGEQQESNQADLVSRWFDEEYLYDEYCTKEQDVKQDN